MENQEKTSYAENTLKKVLAVIRKNLIFIIIVCLLASFAGACFSKLKKPVYTATAKASYYAEVNDKNGEVNPASSVNAMKAYFETVLDYCKTGCVLDRADFFYSEYLDNKSNNPNFTINDLKNLGLNYVAQEDYQRKHYSSSKIIAEKIDEDTQFIFNVSLKDDGEESAKIKLRILLFAFDQEIRYSFGGVDASYIKEYVNDENAIYCVSNVSLIKDVVVSFGIGVVLALFLVYIRSVLDNTITDKEQLEQMVGANVIAYIPKQEDDQYGK